MNKRKKDILIKIIWVISIFFFIYLILIPIHNYLSTIGLSNNSINAMM